jgi:NADH dehydrogenase
VGQLVKDVMITREEIQGLMEERLFVDAPPQGTVRLTDWIEQHKATLGRHYTSEMARRMDRAARYHSN